MSLVVVARIAIVVIVVVIVGGVSIVISGIAVVIAIVIGRGGIIAIVVRRVASLAVVAHPVVAVNGGRNTLNGIVLSRRSCRSWGALSGSGGLLSGAAIIGVVVLFARLR